MFESVQRSIDALLQPIGLIWAALLLATVLQLVKRRILGAMYTATLVAFIQLIGATELPAWLMADLERPYDPLVIGWPTRADAVVMLGGTHDYSARSPVHIGVGEAADRILAAVELTRTTGAGALVLCGSFYELKGVRRPDSELLAELFRVWRLPVGTVHLLGICSDTRVEVQRAVQLAREHHWTRVVVVTSGYHLKRAEALFRKEGLAVMPAGAEFLGLDAFHDHGGGRWSVVPRIRGFELMRFWVHERIGLLYYRCRGWI